jgi:hypothetical protein
MERSRPAFKNKMGRWRTSCEGRISCAKRDFGLTRTRIDGLIASRPPNQNGSAEPPRPTSTPPEFFRSK